MATVKQVVVNSVLSVEDETSNTGAGSSDRTVKFDLHDLRKTLTGTSAPPVSKQASYDLTLSAGAGTIDLTAVPGLDGTVDMTGLKIVAFKIKGKTNNANAITVAKGASNGFAGLGAAFSVAVKAGQEHLFYCGTTADAVSGTNKILDVTGTGSQVLHVQIVAGA